MMLSIKFGDAASRWPTSLRPMPSLSGRSTGPDEYWILDQDSLPEFYEKVTDTFVKKYYSFRKIPIGLTAHRALNM